MNTAADAPPERPLTPAPIATTRLATLAEVETAVWRELAGAVHDKQHPWRVGVLATTDGAHADARSVVLRDLELGLRTLLVYTDARSVKAQQIANFPQGTLVLWSAALGWQLRLRVRLQLRTEGLQVSSRWARLKMTPAAQDYLSPLPPGSRLPHPAPARGSRGHFGVIAAEVRALDWLELHADGHRRACFDAEGARWLVP